MRPYELFVGLRYTRAKRRTHFVSFITFISIAGIALGIWSLITVLSVMNGFEKEVRARLLGAAAHVQIIGGPDGVANWEDLVAEVKRHPQVVAAAPFVAAQGLLSTGTRVKGVVIRGIVPELEDQVADFGRAMKSGKLADLRPGESGIALGIHLAESLKLAVGDRVTLLSPQGQAAGTGLMPRLRQFTVTGIFSLDHNEFDSGLALVHMQDAQALSGLGSAVTGVRLKVKDLDRAPQVTRELARAMPLELYLTDWTQQNVNYFRAVQMQKKMMFVILTLIMAVAAFNLVSTLVMAVTDKHPDIAILRTLGASPGSIMQVFVVQGMVIGLVGTALGVVTGILTALNIDVVVPAIETALRIRIMTREIYFLSELPSDLHWDDVIGVALVSLLLSLVSTLYPSWRASRVNPAEALRYE